MTTDPIQALSEKLDKESNPVSNARAGLQSTGRQTWKPREPTIFT